MKKVIVVLLIISSFFAFSCSDSKKEKADNQALSPTIHTIIFIDKTRSVDVNKPFVANKFEKAINALIEENVRKAGDKLEVYYIHENTAKSRCLSLTSRTEMEDLAGMNATDKEAAQTNYDLSIRKERNFFQQQTVNRLMAENSSTSNKETDILASIPVIAKASENNDIVKVYYLSDMVESMMSAGRRDFEVKPPKDDAEAEEWAKIDAEKFKKYSLNNPEITMVLPFEPTSSRQENNPTVTHYWQKLFADLGVMTVNEL